uniref:SUI1 domain-containing protein n=1 Tax=Caenorhabditis tropicalis TaxID=1561998 RepID=A0A1I7TSK4_9PELO
MFKKPFTVKKNTNQRNSDTRKLLSRLKDQIFVEPNIDKKGQVAQVKLTNADGHLLNLYSIDRTPMLFDFDEHGNLYPTVYFMWNNPRAFPVLVCHEPVFTYLENGADLMMPGIIQSGVFPFPTFPKGAPVSIAFYSTETKKVSGPSAIGVSLMCSDDMESCGFRGKGVQVLHVFRDQLWEFGPKGLPPSFTLEEWIKLGEKPVLSDSDEEETCEQSEVNTDQNPSSAQEKEELVEEIPEEPMENLLVRSFLAGLKYRFNRSMLPMDVGQFYTQCVLSCVPDGRKLDMKKTQYKKFATFLNAVNEEGDEWIIKVVPNKQKKGADVVSDVNFSNKRFRDFEVTDERIVDQAPVDKAKFDAPTIAEYFAITEPTLKIFPGCSKGDLLNVKEIKEFVTKYVNDNKLASGKSVRLDPTLFSISRIKADTALWADLMKEIHARMTATWHIRWADGREIFRKVTAPKVEFKIENRAGNKKVTLINGLAMFGIDIRTICHQIQTGVATSVSSQWEVQGVEGPQVLVQGNQIHFVADMLTKSYGIDKKYMKGTELAVKKKK